MIAVGAPNAPHGAPRIVVPATAGGPATGRRSRPGPRVGLGVCAGAATVVRLGRTGRGCVPTPSTATAMVAITTIEATAGHVPSGPTPCANHVRPRVACVARRAPLPSRWQHFWG